MNACLMALDVDLTASIQLTTHPFSAILLEVAYDFYYSQYTSNKSFYNALDTVNIKMLFHVVQAYML